MQTLRGFSMLPIVLALACGPSVPPDPDGGSAGDGGGPDPAVIDVDATPGTTLDHAASGLRFRFPEGGSGRLRVDATDVPPPVEGATAYTVTFTGSAPVALVLPVVEGHHAQVFAFGDIPGTCEGPSDCDARWGALPPRARGSAENVFLLPLPVPNALEPGPTQTTFATLTLARDDRDIEREAKARAFLAQAIGSVPEPLRATAQARLDAAPPTFASGPESHYTGFDWGPWAGTYASPVVTLRLDADDDVVAHEIGHLVTHLLAGDGAYRAIEDLAPDKNHGLGVDQGRATVTEDYAYYIEFVLGRNKRCDHVRSILGERDPAAVDVPSLEGFGCALLGSLTAPQRDLWNLPMTGAGFAPGDVLAVYASGATTVDGLYDAIHSFLATQGKADQLPALAEAMGWSYRVTGTAADTDGTPIPDAALRLMRADFSTISGASAVADGGGVFQLSRATPGRNDLVLRPPDTDVSLVLPFEIDHARRTPSAVTAAARFPEESAHVVASQVEVPYTLGDVFSTKVRYTLTLDVQGVWEHPQPGWDPGRQVSWGLKSWRDTGFTLAVEPTIDDTTLVREAGDWRLESTFEVRPRYEVASIFGLGTPLNASTNIVTGGALSWSGRQARGTSAGAGVWVDVLNHETRKDKVTGDVLGQYTYESRLFLGNLVFRW